MPHAALQKGYVAALHQAPKATCRCMHCTFECSCRDDVDALRSLKQLCSNNVDFTFTGGVAKQTALSTCFCPLRKLPSLPVSSVRPAAMANPLAASWRLSLSSGGHCCTSYNRNRALLTPWLCCSRGPLRAHVVSCFAHAAGRHLSGSSASALLLQATSQRCAYLCRRRILLSASLCGDLMANRPQPAFPACPCSSPLMLSNVPISSAGGHC